MNAFIATEYEVPVLYLRHDLASTYISFLLHHHSSIELRLRLVCLADLVASSRQQAAAAAAQQRQGHGRTSTHTIKLCCIPVCEASNTAHLERHSPSIRRPFGSASLRLTLQRRNGQFLTHLEVARPDSHSLHACRSNLRISLDS
eukprot:COSAG02_NODE_7684_length_2895_cov_7.093705_1_plen_144_part_10